MNATTAGGVGEGDSSSGSSSKNGCSSFLLIVKEDISSLAALFERRALPATAVGVGIAALSQVCGINAILFFAAPFFSSLTGEGVGGNNNPSVSSGLLSAVVVGLALFGFTLVALALVDRVGRRSLLLVGGGVMLASELALAGLLGYFLGGSKSSSSPAQQLLLPRGAAAGALFLMCCFVAAFASSLGPLGWLVPTEVFSAKDRSAGQALATTVNFLFVFITTQFFLASLCAMRHWTFVAAAGAVVVLLLFAQFLMPVSGERERESVCFSSSSTKNSKGQNINLDLAFPSISITKIKTGNKGHPHRPRLGAVEGPPGLVEVRRGGLSGRGGRMERGGRAQGSEKRRRRRRRKEDAAAEEGEWRLREVERVIFFSSEERYCRARNQSRSLFL